MSLIKQHLYNMSIYSDYWSTSSTPKNKMKFQVTDIKFDCSLDDCDYTESERIYTEEMMNESYIGTIWEADDGDDLIEEITAVAGWCINSIDYRIILK